LEKTLEGHTIKDLEELVSLVTDKCELIQRYWRMGRHDNENSMLSSHGKRKLKKLL